MCVCVYVCVLLLLLFENTFFVCVQRWTVESVQLNRPDINRSNVLFFLQVRGIFRQKFQMVQLQASSDDKQI